MNSTQRATLDAQRRSSFRTFGNNARAHLRKRGDHPVHWTFRQPWVCHQPTLEFLSCQQTREKPHGRARITAIDFFVRCGEYPPFSVNDQRGSLRLLDLDSQSAHCIDRVHAIFAGKKSAQRAHAVGESGDNHRSMRNAFIARYGDFEIDSRSPLYPQLHRMNLNVVMLASGARIETCAALMAFGNRISEISAIRSPYGTRKILSV